MGKQVAPGLFSLVLMVVLLLVHSGVEAEPETHAHAMDDPLIGRVLVDQLEWQDTEPWSTLHFDANAWLGTDKDRAVFRSEGSLMDGQGEDIRAELLWSRPLAAWWNLVSGVRQDWGIGPGRTYGLIGVEGLAPYWFHVAADVFGGEGGQIGTRLESALDLLITNRLVLTPRVELQAFARDDEATGVGKGLSDLSLGLRLRYEIRREIAPYIGIEWNDQFGATEDYARADGTEVGDTRWVAGLRFWF